MFISKTGKKFKVIVVLPAYNAEGTLAATAADVPQGIVDEMLLVDDASSDNTVQIAHKLGLTVLDHKINRGYGAGQKTGYIAALQHGADIVIMLHPDYQYDPKFVPYFIDFIANGHFDVMLGSRIRSRKEALAGGMPIYKYFFNRLLTIFENIVSGHNLSEWHTGMRAYKSAVLKNIDFLKFSDDFVFDSQMLFRIIEQDYRIGEIPVPVKYFPEASSINFRRSIKYGFQTIWTALKYSGRKLQYGKYRKK